MPKTNVAAVVDQPTPLSARVIAGLVDATAVTVPTAVVGLLLAERFPIIGEIDGRTLFNDPDQLRINEIDEGFNRAVRLGDVVVTLSGGGWWLTMLTLVTLTVMIFVVLPSRLRWRTPGRLALGLPRPADPTLGMLPTDVVTVLNPATVPATADEPATSAIPATPDEPATATVPRAATATADPTPGNEATTPAPAAAEAEPEPVTIAASLRSTGAERAVTLDDPGPAARITLADANEYLEWDRFESRLDLAPTGGGPAAGSGFGALTLPESSLAESPLHASTTTLRRPAAVSARTSTGTAGATVEPPVWSDVCQAWVYRDPNSDRWFRHDTERNRWVPIK